MLQGMGTVPPPSPGVKNAMGWDFSQDGTWFTGSTLDEVVKKVTEYREANNLPVGDPKQEVTDFNEAKMRKVTSVKIIPNLRENVIKWLESRLRKKPKYVDEETANQRAAICSTCPLNVIDWSKGEKCQRCVENANRASAVILMGRRQHSTIGACRELAQQNRVAVWLDEPKVNDPALPDFCWKKA